MHCWLTYEIAEIADGYVIRWYTHTSMCVISANVISDHAHSNHSLSLNQRSILSLFLLCWGACSSREMVYVEYQHAFDTHASTKHFMTCRNFWTVGWRCIYVLKPIYEQHLAVLPVAVCSCNLSCSNSCCRNPRSKQKKTRKMLFPKNINVLFTQHVFELQYGFLSGWLSYFNRFKQYSVVFWESFMLYADICTGPNTSGRNLVRGTAYPKNTELVKKYSENHGNA